MKGVKGIVMRFEIEHLKDASGNKYWILFTHGMFHEPTAVIEDSNMRYLVEFVIGSALNATTEDLGKRIREYRKAHRMTQEQFADLSGVSRNRISTIENGRGNITTDTIYKLQVAMAE